MARQFMIYFYVGLFCSFTLSIFAKDAKYYFQYHKYENIEVNFGEKSRIRRASDVNSSIDMTSNTTALINVTIASSINPTLSTFIPVTTTTPTPQPLYVKDNHTYYEQNTYTNSSHGLSKYYSKIFDDIFLNEKEKKYIKHIYLSNSHRSALQIPLKFPFLYYGHIVKNITIATGGFLYVSDFLHQYLTYTQYIAPLMANFATRDPSMAEILYYDNGEAFFVKWSKVYIASSSIKDKTFTFEAAIFKNGTIVFVYKEIPMHLSTIDVSNHAMKVGLSDGFYVDKTIRIRDNGREYLTTHRTIYRYHKIDIDVNLVRNGTVVIFHAFPTCIEQDTCRTCRNPENVPHFSCAWCTKLARCSSGIDRHRQSWLENNCDAELQQRNADMCPKTIGAASGVDAEHLAKSRVASIVILVCLLALAFSVTLALWLWYAYTHPNSKSGLCLIENRPSQLRHKIASLCRWKYGRSAENYSVSVMTSSHEENA